MRKVYLIFVPDETLDDGVEYSKVIKWCYDNLSHQNVMSLSLDDVYMLQYKSKVLDIINEENDSMLQEGEDDWIIPNNTKLKIQKRIEAYSNSIINERENELVNGLLKLIEVSIKSNKPLYFIF